MDKRIHHKETKQRRHPKEDEVFSLIKHLADCSLSSARCAYTHVTHPPTISVCVSVSVSI